MQYRKALLINFCAALACFLIGLATAMPMPQTLLAPGDHIANITFSVQIIHSVNGSAADPSDESNTTSTSSTTSTSLNTDATPADSTPSNTPTPTPTPSSTSSESPTSFPEATPVTVVKQMGTYAVVLASQGTTTTVLLATITANGTDAKTTSSQ